MVGRRLSPQRAVLAKHTIINTLMLPLHDLDEVEGGAVEYDGTEPGCAAFAGQDARVRCEQGDQMRSDRMSQ